MRRHPVTLLKYLIVGFVCVVMGPFAIRLLFGSVDNTKSETVHADNSFLRREVEKDLINKGNVAVVLGKKEKYDWHNYKLIEEDIARKGPGEQGAAVILTPEEEKQKDVLYKTNGFNAFVSDKISLQRSLKDIRHPDCAHKKYLYHLPNASVVVPFHNEHWSTLLRTVYSVLNRSPKHLIHEVILVDDFSTKEHCKAQLDKYVNTYFTNVKVIRAKQREGLIRTRLLGAKNQLPKIGKLLFVHLLMSLIMKHLHTVHKMKVHGELLIGKCSIRDYPFFKVTSNILLTLSRVL